MSGANLTSAAINGAVRGQLIGAAIGGANDAAAERREYNKLVGEYNGLVGQIKDLRGRLQKMGELYQKSKEDREELVEMIDDLNKTVGNLNSSLLSVNSDRTKAYEFIIQLSEIVRQHEPDNEILSNPNSILSQVNFYSAKRMKDTSELVSNEMKSGNMSQFSKNQDKNRLDEEMEKRLNRAGQYKSAADAGITDVDKSITPTY